MRRNCARCLLCYDGLIVRLEVRLTLLEAMGKKGAFLEHIIKRLDLEGAEVTEGRVGELGWDLEQIESIMANTQWRSSHRSFFGFFPHGLAKGSPWPGSRRGSRSNRWW